MSALVRASVRVCVHVCVRACMCANDLPDEVVDAHTPVCVHPPGNAVGASMLAWLCACMDVVDPPGNAVAMEPTGFAIAIRQDEYLSHMA